MRSWLVIGILVAAQLLVGVVIATGSPERTEVSAIELRAAPENPTTEETGSKNPAPKGAMERRERKSGEADDRGGAGAAPAPTPAPAPAGEDEDDDDRNEREDESEGGEGEGERGGDGGERDHAEDGDD